jgi:hypothetical protein
MHIWMLNQWLYYMKRYIETKHEIHGGWVITIHPLVAVVAKYLGSWKINHWIQCGSILINLRITHHQFNRY